MSNTKTPEEIVSMFTLRDPVGSFNYVKPDDALLAAKQYSAQQNRAYVKALKKIVEQEESKHRSARSAADTHNNSDGVGIHFDYMTVPSMPKWVDEIKSLIQNEGK